MNKHTQLKTLNKILTIILDDWNLTSYVSTKLDEDQGELEVSTPQNQLFIKFNGVYFTQTYLSNTKTNDLGRMFGDLPSIIKSILNQLVINDYLNRRIDGLITL